MRHGPGACKYKDNGVYEGMFRKDDRHGHGVQTETNGDRPSTFCFADHFFFRLNALHCLHSATGRIIIPAECFAVP